MATNDDFERETKGVLGDINPNPDTHDHLTRNEPHALNDDNEKELARLPDLDKGSGGTRNYRQGTGANSGDIGNKPE
jgi:hypothetical protein